MSPRNIAADCSIGIISQECARKGGGFSFKRSLNNVSVLLGNITQSHLKSRYLCCTSPPGVCTHKRDMRETHRDDVLTPLTLSWHKDCKLYHNTESTKDWLSKEILSPSRSQGQIAPDNIWTFAQWPLWGKYIFTCFLEVLENAVLALFSLLLHSFIKPNMRSKIIKT